MLYITKISKEEATEKKILIRFLEQFDGPYQIMMLGHIVFANDMLEFSEKIQKDDRNTEEQKAVIKRAGSLITYLTGNMLDQLTDLYEGIGEEEHSSLDKEDRFVAGYRNGLNYYREATADILDMNTFKGKDRGIAMTYYTSIGLDLAEKLEWMMSKPEDAAASVKEYMIMPTLPCF